VCRWGADYGDFDWTVLIRTLERVSSSGVLESRGSRVRGRGFARRPGSVKLGSGSNPHHFCTEYARTCTAPDVQHARSSARESSGCEENHPMRQHSTVQHNSAMLWSGSSGAVRPTSTAARGPGEHPTVTLEWLPGGVTGC
jgi:hypothetical protein